MLALVFLFVAAGVLFIGLAVPLIRRRSRPNGFYGLRVPATLADEAVWYEANARSGRDLLVFGALTVACAVALPLSLNLMPGGYGFVMSALLVIGALALCFVGWRRANRLLAERRDEPS